MDRRFRPSVFGAPAALALLIGTASCSSGYTLPSGTIAHPGPAHGAGTGLPGDGGSVNGVDAGQDAGMPDSGCTPLMAVTGCYGLGQACQPVLGSTGGCISPLQCYARFSDAGALTYTCCDLSTGLPQC